MKEMFPNSNVCFNGKVLGAALNDYLISEFDVRPEYSVWL
jgi:hypothetical protein